MIIPRNTIAILLETRPSNIKSLRQDDNHIYIQLSDSEHELSMTLEEYQNCSKQLRQHKGHIDSSKFATLAIIIGIFISVTISTMNATLVNQDNQNSPLNSAELISENN